MIDVSDEKPAGLIKAEELLEKANNRLRGERRKAGEQKRKQDNHNKIIMGGIVKKYFPECIYFEQHDLKRILNRKELNRLRENEEREKNRQKERTNDFHQGID